jgi:7-cyano-7-deazaguanine reductase
VDDVELASPREHPRGDQKRVARQKEPDEQTGLGEDDDRHRGQTADAHEGLDVGQLMEDLFEPLHGRPDGSRRIRRVGFAAMPEYTDAHARSGIDAKLPAIETWPNQYADYEITVEIPEYNAICPKTGLPDFGHLTIRYVPDRLCLELKSLKLYIVAYRNVGIFYENAVNRILEDCVAACRPKRMTITGRFSSRGGISSTIEASYPRS